MAYNAHNYNPKLRNYAHENRNEATKAEACIWKYVLKAGQMQGFGFNRQRPIINYIVDFVCLSLKLIIEVDGGYHFEPEVEKKDKKRQKDLENLGYMVLRFTNEEVLNHIDYVRKTICEWIEANKGEVKIREVKRR